MKVLPLAKANAIADVQPDINHAPRFRYGDYDGLVFLCDVNEIVTHTHVSNCSDTEYLYTIVSPYLQLFDDRGYDLTEWLETLSSEMHTAASQLHLKDWELTKETDSVNQGVMIGLYSWNHGVVSGYPSYEWQTYFTNNDGEVTSYGRRMAMEKSSSRFMPVRDLEQNIGARYTKCVMCQCFNKVRTHMVPIRHAKPGARKAWSNRKNVCISCIKYVAKDQLVSQNRPNLRLWTGSVGFDGVDQLFYNPSRDDWSWNDTWGNDDVFENANAEYKRFFRKLDEDTIFRIKMIERIDIPRWTYRFDTTFHDWNYRFPVRLVGIGEDGLIESDSPGGDYQDTDWFYRTGPYYGMEFECFVRNDRSDYRDSNIVMADAIRMFHDTDYPKAHMEFYDGEHQLLYRKRDGSLRDGVGVEFVSQPLSYDYWMKEVPQRFWDYFQNNFRARNSEECGIHIHIGWDSMQVAERYVFLKILNELNKERSPLLAAIAGRNSTYYATWNTLFYQGSADTAFMVAMEKKQTSQSSTPKYNAINTLHDSTIELRYFQGNTGRKSILGIVQFVDLIYRHAVDVIHSDTHSEGTRWDYTQEGPRTFLQSQLDKINNNVDEYLLDVLSNYPKDRIAYLIHRLEMADYELPENISI